jgi:MFS family permease
VPLRTVFLLAAIPAALSVLVLVLWVRETGEGAADHLPPPVVGPRRPAEGAASSLGSPFWAFFASVLLFTLGNSTDAFLILRATELGVPVALIPVLWAALHVTKSGASAPGGALSDRVGRKPLIVAGWMVYALVYLGFARASETWHAWALFLAYGTYFGLTEGTERAMVADLVPASRRGTAYGWYNLGIGLAALPASVLFGVLWQRFGSAVAFQTGAAIALAASVLLWVGVRGAR